MKNTTLFLCITFLSNSFCYCQKQKSDGLKLIIKPTYGTELIKKSHWYISNSKDSIQFSKIKFYLTEIKFITASSKKIIQKEGYLIDAFDENTLTLNFNNIAESVDEISFNIGVIESMNTDGALAGDLDPSNGMYWSWQSGYINLKVEGKSPSCNTRKSKFQFHIGGYKEPNTTTRKIILRINSENKNEVTLVVDFSKLFEEINLSKENQIMIPGKKAKELADYSINMFSIDE